MPQTETAHARVVDTQAAAAYVGLSKSWLQKARVYGEGPKFCKLGRRVVYLLDDLDSWLKRRRRTSTSANTNDLPAGQRGSR